MTGTRYMLKRMLVLITVFVFTHQALAQRELKFDNFGTDEGLASNFVDWVFTDSYGYLWAGTFDGLNRYDGNTYKQYSQTAELSGLSNNSVVSVYEDWDNQLWVTTLGGLNTYHRQTDKFSPFAFPGNKNVYEVAGVVQVNDSIVFIGSFSGLWKYNKRSRQFVNYTTESHGHGLRDSMVSCLKYDASRKQLWIGTISSGVHKMDVETNRIQHFSEFAPADIQTKLIRRFELDGKGKLWVATFGEGVAVVDLSTFRFKIYNSQNSNLGSNLVQMLKKTSDGRMWACCINGYLNEFDPSNQTFHQYLPDMLNPYSIKGSSVVCMDEDRDGNLWVATHGHGISLVDKQKQVFEHKISKVGNARFLNSSIVTDFLELGNELWVATDGGGINVLDMTKGTFRYITTSNGLHSNFVLDIEHGPNNQLFVASWQGGIDIIDTRTGSIRDINSTLSKGDDMVSKNLKSLLRDDTLLWISSHGGGVSVYDIKNRVFVMRKTHPYFKFNFKVPLHVNRISKDSRNRLWISTQHGLYMFDGKLITSYTKRGISRKGIVTDNVNNVFEDSKKRLWLVSELGISLFDEQRGAFDFVGPKLGLPLSAKAMIEDKNGLLWISTKEGLFSLDYEQRTVRRFGREDGLISDYYFRNSAYLLSDGRVAFGSIQGYNIFSPDSISSIDNQRPVFIKKLMVNNKEVLPGDSTGILRHVIDFTDTIVLANHINEVTVNFSTINPSSEGKAAYMYRLTGYNNEWRASGAQRSAHYTNLGHGTYTFEVKMSPTGNRVNSPVKSLVIIIKAAWWQTNWFKLVMAMCLTLIIVLLSQVNALLVKRKNKLLEKEVEKRTAQLTETNDVLQTQNKLLELRNREIVEQNTQISKQQQQLELKNAELSSLNKKKDKFFSIIGHDLKNPIGAIIGLSEILHEKADTIEPERIRKYAHSMIFSANSVYSLLINLLDWSKTESKSITVKPEYFPLWEVIDSTELLLSQQMTDKSLSFIKTAASKTQVYADKNMTETVVRNIISNAIKFTPRGGTITISSFVDDEMAVLSILDSGVGMTPDQLSKLFSLGDNNSTPGTNNEKGTGLGLLICKDFIEMNNGCLKVNSQAGKGTEFQIFIPTMPASKPMIQ